MTTTSMNPLRRVALVTGANKGIGKEICRQLATQGVFVFLGARNRERGQQAEAGLRAAGLLVQFVPLDVTNQESVDEAAAQVEKQFGRLDILINNAGIAMDWVAPSQLDMETLQNTYATNVFGAFRVIKAMLPLLQRSKAGRIVNLSSATASLTLAAAPDGFNRASQLMAYCSSKTALNAITLAFARDLKDAGIKVNSANPGYVATDMNQGGTIGLRGARGVKTVEQGAATPVRLALLPDDGPTGGFFSDEGIVPW